MSAVPLIDEHIVEQQLIMPGTPASGMYTESPQFSRLSKGQRRFQVFDANSGFDVIETIESIRRYCLEPNVFFSPRFCVPAMPRLDDRSVRLMVLHDTDDSASETRFLMPFTVEKPGFAVGPDIIRAWSNPFGPSGCPLVERREAAKIIEDVFATIAQKTVKLPKIIALPDVMVDGPTVSIIRSVALSNGLPIATTKTVERSVLDATRDADSYFQEAIGSHHRRDAGRLWRNLEKVGALKYDIARSEAAVRTAMEEFLFLENKGWKGQQKTSLSSDRYRTAFAREAINSLAERDACRIHTLKLDGTVIAALIVFVEDGRAWTWKTAYDEELRSYSPGKLLMVRATETLLDDPNIFFADSCALPGNALMSHLWPETREITSLVIGLDVAKDKEVRQVAAQMDLYASTKQTAKNVRDRLKGLVGGR